MRSFLVNKNLCLYYWLKKKIGNKGALRIANTIQKVVLVFGREQLPYEEFIYINEIDGPQKS